MPNPKDTSSSSDGTLSLEDAFNEVASAKPKSSTGTPAPNAAGMATAVAPIVRDAAMEVATNPAVPRVAAAVGRVMGGSAPIVASPTNPMSYLAAQSGAWSGGRAGWFTGQLLQRLAGTASNVAGAVSKVSPGLSAVAAEGSALNRINAPIEARIAELRAQGKSWGEAARQAQNEMIAMIR